MRCAVLLCCSLVFLSSGAGVSGSSPKNDIDGVSLINLDGKKVKFADQRAKVTVVQLWATWCMPCILELPYMEALYNHYKKDKDVAVLSINVEFGDTAGNLPLIRKQVEKLKMPVLVDHQMRLTQILSPGSKKPTNPGPGVTRMSSLQLPLLVIIDAKGRMYRIYGFDTGMSKNKYIEKKREIIELARKGKLPRQKVRPMNDLLPKVYMLAQMGRAAVAEKMLLDALAKNEKDAALLFALGSVYTRMGKPDKSVATVRRILTFEPKNAKAMNLIGYNLAGQGKDLDEAEQLIRKALEIEPENGVFLDSLGWVHYQRGEYEKARAVLEEALELAPAPGEKEIYIHLGETYLKLGLCEKAIQQYKQALKASEKESFMPTMP